MSTPRQLGFIGLGVMGEPMCRNLALKSGLPVTAFDLREAPLARLAEAGVARSPSIAAVAQAADVIFLSLPGGRELRSVCAGEGGLIGLVRAGQVVVDLTTAPVGLTRELAQRFAEHGVDYADAPVARTRQAARDGTLSVMVGASAELYARLRPLIACFASEITHCGSVGAGQVVKIMNNMILTQTVVALAEALTIGRRAGLEGDILLQALAKGSADSFALRNHGMKALLPGRFPRHAFPTEYQLKDLGYALELAAEHGVPARGAETARTLLEATVAKGYGAAYWPALLAAVDDGAAIETPEED